MQRISQTLEGIIGSLSRIDTEWRDGVSADIEKELSYLEKILREGQVFDESLIETLLNKNLETYLTIFRLFLEYSKDEIEGSLRESLPHGIGVKAFKKDSKPFIGFFVGLHLIDIVNGQLSRQWSWKDVIIERLKLGRGSAIKGQKRGRFLEKAVEGVIKEVFGAKYSKNCNFVGLHVQEAKCEFAVPNKESPRILFEAKAYGATGSKQTDVIGDIEKIIRVKKPLMEFLLITDGITWKQRVSDLRKIVKYQNNGDIRKIYTLSMFDELRKDLLILKSEHDI